MWLQSIIRTKVKVPLQNKAKWHQNFSFKTSSTKKKTNIPLPQPLFPKTTEICSKVYKTEIWYFNIHRSIFYWILKSRNFNSEYHAWNHTILEIWKAMAKQIRDVLLSALRIASVSITEIPITWTLEQCFLWSSCDVNSFRGSITNSGNSWPWEDSMSKNGINFSGFGAEQLDCGRAFVLIMLSTRMATRSLINHWPESSYPPPWLSFFLCVARQMPHSVCPWMMWPPASGEMMTQILWSAIFSWFYRWVTHRDSTEALDLSSM